MILLTASPLNLDGRYQFRIEAPDIPPAVTCDPVKAAKLLHVRGVSSPLTLVEHAKTWGNVEIVVAE